jgi:mono/diheme cytochrome c family protein
MPEFGKTLSDEEIAAVAAFERLRFGGEEERVAVVGCGCEVPG